MTASQILIIVLIAFGLVAIGGWFESRRVKRLMPYLARGCMGRGWRRRFPAATKEEIREFLAIFIDSFGFPSGHKLKFEPDDRLMDIHRALNPSPNAPDGEEVENFIIRLEEEYGIDISTQWDKDVALGDVFERIMARRTQDARVRPDV